MAPTQAAARALLSSVRLPVGYPVALLWRAVRAGVLGIAGLAGVVVVAVLVGVLGRIGTEGAVDSISPQHALAPIEHAPTPAALVADPSSSGAPTVTGADELFEPPGAGVDAVLGNAAAVALGSMGATTTPRAGIPAHPRASAGGLASVAAEDFAADAGLVGSGVPRGGGRAGGSGAALAILLALGVIAGPRLPGQRCTDYQRRLMWIFSRPLVRPG
ncbi:MAG: hypothetical protein ACRDQX_06380 [Pseudonocardiaceae bacterium]